MNLSDKYEALWKAIIRPPRASYNDSNLGMKIQRTDLTLTNKRGLKLKCSHYEPYLRPCKQLPCVIYLHGNSSCRLQGYILIHQSKHCIPFILCHDITLFTFDFAGCGNSEGEYISLGFYERDDVDTVFQYLRQKGTVSSIGLWGRSMGAVTALMYADKNPQIACIVCDSAFSNLQKLCKQLAERFANGLISFFSGVALTFVSNTIKEKNNFPIESLDPLGKHVKKAYIPAYFIAAKEDTFVLPKHTQRLYEEYAGQKKISIIEGDHNSQRSIEVNEMISVFFYNNLHVEKLIVKDIQYMQQQQNIKEQFQAQLKNINKSPQLLAQKPKLNAHFLATYENKPQQVMTEDQILQYALKLSLEEYQQNCPHVINQKEPDKSTIKNTSKKEQNNQTQSEEEKGEQKPQKQSIKKSETKNQISFQHKKIDLQEQNIHKKDFEDKFFQ